MAELKVKSGDSYLEFTVQEVQPKKLIVNGPATVILWDDGTKTVAKCNTDEQFDPEKGVAIAIAKRFISGTKLHRMFDDAGFQLIDNSGMKSLLVRWAETMTAIANAYGSSSGGDQK